MINSYAYLIAERFNDLLNSGITKEQLNNFQLAKIFEYYTCVKFTEKYNRLFYVYDDIDPIFKEDNFMSRNDTGIDASDLNDSIVQCKLRKDSLTLSECATFFASQNQFNKKIGKTDVRWQNMFIARNSDSVLSEHMQEKLNFCLFVDHTFDKQEMLDYCENLLKNFKPITEPSLTKKVKLIKKCNNKIISEEFVYKNIVTPLILRDYQQEVVNFIENKQNIIINLPTATGKNIIIISSLKQNKKYLILVPRIILMDQLNDEIIKFKPDLVNDIQLIGDGNNNFDKNKNITICVYNSIDIIKNYCNLFDKIFIDEAHHILKPEIYKSDEDTNNEQINQSINQPINELINQPINEQVNENLVKINIADLFANRNLNKNAIEINENDDEYDENNEYDESDDLVDDSEDEFKNTKSFTMSIRELKKYNNNVCLSATIDEENGFLYYKKDIRDMIENGYLCDYTIHVPIFSNDPSNKKICEYLINNYRTIIVYCNSCKEGKQIRDIFNDLQKGSAEYMDCYTSKTIRRNIIKNFKDGKIPFLVNVRILTEGFDAKNTQGVCFLHMPSNKTTIIQIIGRALRLHPNKKYANIILPYGIKDDEININKFLKILANNDQRIKQSFCNKKTGGYINIEMIDDCLNEDVLYKYEQIYSSLGKLLNSEEIWMGKLEQVKKYIDENIYKTFNDFINDPKYNLYFIDNDEEWLNNLKQVKKYIDENNKRPPTNEKHKEDNVLGKWLSKQLTNSKTQKYGMRNENIYKTFNDFINDPKYNLYFIDNDKEWLNNLKQVKKYIDENNKRPPTYEKNGEYNLLGKWLSHQITNSKTRKQIMENENIYKTFNDFINDPKYNLYFISDDERWSNNLVQVKKYIDENNRKPPTQKKNKKNNILGNWLSNQLTNSKTRKQIMENENIYKTFNDFINNPKYKSYFK